MSTISPSKRESSGDRRAAIALAARTLIAEKGFEGLRTRDIAERVGINVATLHYHVPTKEALIELVAASLRDELRAQAERHSRAGLSPMQQLRLEFADYRESLTETPDVLRVLSELHMRAKRDPKVGEVIVPMDNFWVGQFEDILRAGIEDGSFRTDMDAGAAALMLTAALKIIWRNADVVSAFDRLAAEIERSVRNPTALTLDPSR